jgi:hypothetical protein
MLTLIVSIIVFNFIAFKTNKRLTAIQIGSIWTFTIAFQLLFDLFVEFKYDAYWYINKGVEWKGLLPRTVLIPPVNIMFLNWYPFKAHFFKQIIYLTSWVIGILIYEAVTLLPEPWGYFHYDWWKLSYSALVDPILFIILLGYYKWICKLENK